MFNYDENIYFQFFSVYLQKRRLYLDFHFPSSAKIFTNWRFTFNFTRCLLCFELNATTSRIKKTNLVAKYPKSIITCDRTLLHGEVDKYEYLTPHPAQFTSQIISPHSWVDITFYYTWRVLMIIWERSLSVDRFFGGKLWNIFLVDFWLRIIQVFDEQ